MGLESSRKLVWGVEENRASELVIYCCITNSSKHTEIITNQINRAPWKWVIFLYRLIAHMITSKHILFPKSVNI